MPPGWYRTSVSEVSDGTEPEVSLTTFSPSVASECPASIFLLYWDQYVLLYHNRQRWNLAGKNPECTASKRNHLGE